MTLTAASLVGNGHAYVGHSSKVVGVNGASGGGSGVLCRQENRPDSANAGADNGRQKRFSVPGPPHV